VCILRLGRVALGINEGNFGMSCAILAYHVCLFGCGMGVDVGDFGSGRMCLNSWQDETK